MNYEEYIRLKDYSNFASKKIREQQKEIERLNKELQQKENIIKELKDKIEDDKMIIEGNWGCIDNLRKDYNLQKNIIKEVREWAKKYSCQFTNDDGEFVVSEISFNIQARPCDLFKILDKENYQYVHFEGEPNIKATGVNLWNERQNVLDKLQELKGSDK